MIKNGQYYYNYDSLVKYESEEDDVILPLSHIFNKANQRRVNTKTGFFSKLKKNNTNINSKAEKTNETFSIIIGDARIINSFLVSEVNNTSDMSTQISDSTTGGLFFPIKFYEHFLDEIKNCVQDGSIYNLLRDRVREIKEQKENWRDRKSVV